MFGMGTGGSLRLLSPEILCGCEFSFALLRSLCLFRLLHSHACSTCLFSLFRFACVAYFTRSLVCLLAFHASSHPENCTVLIQTFLFMLFAFAFAFAYALAFALHIRFRSLHSHSLQLLALPFACADLALALLCAFPDSLLTLSLPLASFTLRSLAFALRLLASLSLRLLAFALRFARFRFP